MKRTGYYTIGILLTVFLASLTGFSQAQAQILAMNSEDRAEDAVESRCQDPLGEPGVRSDALTLDSRVHAVRRTGVVQTQDVSSGLVAYYPFNGNADDESGNSNDGIVNGATLTADRFGDPDSAFEFDGTASFIQLPSTLMEPNDWVDGFSVTWWQEADFTSEFRAVWRLEEDKNIQSFYNAPEFGNGMCVALFQAPNGPWISVCDSNPPTDWVFYGFTFDGQNMILYKNGEPWATNTSNGIRDKGPGATLGNRISGSGNPLADFDGKIDEFRVYDRALTEAEIQELSSGDSGGSQEIVFGSPVDGSYDLWLVHPDGTGRANLSKVSHDPDGLYWEDQPRWSADGSKVTFISNKSGIFKVWVMDADGTNDYELTTAPLEEYAPSWSPDGTKIYFARNMVYAQTGGCGPCRHWEIFVFDLTDSTETRLTVNSSRDLSPVVSPDGQRVAFIRAERPNDCCNPTNIWLMDADGSNQRQLVPSSGNNGRYEWTSAWSKNTNKILAGKQFAGSSDNDYEVILASLDGTVERLTNNSVYDYPFTFSPDEQRILILSNEAGDFDLWVMDADGSNRAQFTDEGSIRGADWRVGNMPPTADAGPDQTVECAGSDGADVSLDGTGSSDPDGDALSFSWTENGVEIATGENPTVTLALGPHPITLTVEDGNGGTDTDEVVITVEDTTPPEITVASNPIVLWPPNHKYHTVTLDDFVTGVTDVCDAEVSTGDVALTEVASDEPEDATGSGDGHTTDDIIVSGNCQSVDLRAERQGSGNGRVYTISVAATDARDNTGEASFQVQVPHSKKETAIDDGTAYSVACGASKQGVTATTAVPVGFKLSAAYPNPFNPETVIGFSVPEASPVKLVVYDVLGRQVRVLVDGVREAGTHEVVFEGGELPSGTYLVRMETPQGSFVQTMQLVK